MSGSHPRWPVWAIGALLIVATALAYANSFQVPLLFDDEVSILRNSSLRDLHNIGAVLFPSAHVFSSGRPLLNLSFALNYAWSGLSVPGYHWVNWSIHVLAGFAVFGVIHRTLCLPRLADRWKDAAFPCAVTTTAIWILHPVATAAITYLSQRAESLMSLCYLLTFYCFVRGVQNSRSRLWLAAAACFCIAGALVKEVILTAPIAILLYDRTFISTSFSEALRRRAWFYLALLGTWAVVALLMAQSHVEARGIGYGYGRSGWTYGLIESRAIVAYAKLTVWPSPLVFDYGENPFSSSGVGSVAFLGIVIAAALFSIRLWCRAPLLGFLPIVFFLVLLPTSSVVPIAFEPVAESRLYLALVPAMTVLTLAGSAYAGRSFVYSMMAVALTFGALTFRRNHDYRTAISLWRDTVAKAPGNARAHGNLGLALASNSHALSAAIQEYRKALCLDGRLANTEFNLANALADQGDTKEAIIHYDAAIRLRPGYGAAYNNRGLALTRGSDHADAAIADFERAIAIDATDVEAKYNLANVLADRPEQRSVAIALYREVIAARPSAAEPHNNLALALAHSGDLDSAATELETALHLQPDYAEARRNLRLIQAARARAELGRP